MLAQAAPISITKIGGLAFEGHLWCSRCATGYVVYQTLSAAKDVIISQLSERHRTYVYIREFTISFLLPSSWAWPFPWRCSTTSTEQGRSMTLDLVAICLAEGRPAARWDRTDLDTFVTPTHHCTTFAKPLVPHQPDILYSFQLCRHSAPLTTHFCQRVMQLVSKGHPDTTWQRRRIHHSFLNGFHFYFLCWDGFLEGRTDSNTLPLHTHTHNQKSKRLLLPSCRS